MPLVGGQVRQWEVADDAGVVHDDVDGSVPLVRLGGQPGGLLVVGDVAADEGPPGTRGCEFPAQRLDLLALVDVAGRHRDALGGQREHGGPPDAAGPAGDQGVPALEAEVDRGHRATAVAALARAAASTRSLMSAIWTFEFALMRWVMPVSSSGASGFIRNSCTQRIDTPASIWT